MAVVGRGADDSMGRECGGGQQAAKHRRVPGAQDGAAAAGMGWVATGKGASRGAEGQRTCLCVLFGNAAINGFVFLTPLPGLMPNSAACMDTLPRHQEHVTTPAMKLLPEVPPLVHPTP